MGSENNRLRRKWQDYSGAKATDAEHNFYDVFRELFNGTEYIIESKHKDFSKLYVNIPLSKEEQEEIYTPDKPINRHGIKPDGLIKNTRTGKTIYIEVKRQDGWVEGKKRNAGRGNAHERLCKYFTPGLLQFLRKSGHIDDQHYPFWIVFQGDITRDPCRVREINFWFQGNRNRKMTSQHPDYNYISSATSCQKMFIFVREDLNVLPAAKGFKYNLRT